MTRILELSPKYWAKTVSTLDAKTRSILTRPWEVEGGAVPVATMIADAA